MGLNGRIGIEVGLFFHLSFANIGPIKKVSVVTNIIFRGLFIGKNTKMVKESIYKPFMGRIGLIGITKYIFLRLFLEYRVF